MTEATGRGKLERERETETETERDREMGQSPRMLFKGILPQMSFPSIRYNIPKVLPLLSGAIN
jgi:hypothetical protein